MAKATSYPAPVGDRPIGPDPDRVISLAASKAGKVSPTSAVPAAADGGITLARRLVDAKEAGRLLGCSWRTVMRLADAGKIPWGVKLGALRRWDAVELDRFIADGCRPPKGVGGRR